MHGYVANSLVDEWFEAHSVALLKVAPARRARALPARRAHGLSFCHTTGATVPPKSRTVAR